MTPSFSKIPPGTPCAAFATLETCTVGQLCAQIDLGAGGPPFAPAARFYVLSYLAERLPADNELPVELRFLAALRGCRSLQ
jgi:hypothetical protein